MGRKSRTSKLEDVEVERRVELEDLDDEDDDQFENDGFLDDNLDDEEGENSDDGKQKKRRKKRESKKTYVLDEDDYELLQDNIPGYRRPKLESENFKRLKKARSDGDEGPSGFYSKEEYDRSGVAKENLKRTLFGEEEDSSSDELLNEGNDALLSEDEMADFIVEEVETAEQAASSRSVKANKKKPRQSTGASSRQSVNDIFGGLDDFYKLGPENITKYTETTKLKEKKVEDEFEPILVPEKYMTKKDEHIRETDIPERMQISEETTGPLPPHAMSIDRESNWILNQFKMGMVPWFHKGGSTSATTEEGNELPIVKDDVKRFLELVHVQKLDVPFIAMYRKEECPSLFKDVQEPNEEDQQYSDDKPMLRWHKVLWTILELDTKWLLFQKRKGALQMYYNKRFDEDRNIYDETRIHLDQKFFESIIKSLNVAETEREIDDVDSKFNLHFPPGEVVDEGEFKRPRRKSQYGNCSEARLREVACKIGYSSEEFGLLISLEQMRMDELEDVQETPDDVASKFTCTMFDSPQDVLRGARHMAAIEISCEPFVKKHVRGIFMENVTISTSPTAEGKSTIDSHHQFAGIKWLKEKPLPKFEDVQWLLIQKAEEDNLIQVSIKLPTSLHDKLINDAQEYYISSGVSKYTQLWNEQRKLIIKDAFDGFLLPSMEKEARTLLKSRAKNWLLMEYGRLLWKKVSVGPYQKKGVDGNLSKVSPRVMACCWGPGRPATTFVMLDSFGEVVDVLFAGSLSIRGQNVNDQQRKRNDQQRIVKFMSDHKPEVVVLGAVSVPCSRLKEDITEIILKTVDDSSEDGLTVVYGDESLPRLYENSDISSDQFPSQSGSMRIAL